jgi:signal transduction histidine kinase/CheY-like chemotaxis protein
MFPWSRRLMSAQVHVFLLALIIIAPVLLFVGILVVNLAGAERERIEAAIHEKANFMAAALDRELAGLQYTLYALGNAPVLDEANFPAFHKYIQEVARARNATIVLRDPESRQILNSVIPWGGPLPQGSALASVDAEVAELRRPVVSGWFHGIVTKRSSYAVVMPILRDDKLAYFLSLSTNTDPIHEIMTKAGIGENEVAVVIDRAGIVLARSRDNDVFVGTRARGTLLQLDAPSGQISSENIDGVDITSFYRHSLLAGWTIAVSVPTSTLNEPIWRSLRMLALLGIALLAISLVSAAILARNLSRTMGNLARGAEALGRQEPVPASHTSVREIYDVWEHLKHASGELQQRTDERDAAEAALRGFNATLEQEVAVRTTELSETNARLMAEIQHREQSEDRIRQLQKIEAVGQLTGGIAHDFNNMMAAILGGLRLIERRLSRGDTNVGNLIEGATESANRAVQLTKRLLAFSRQQALSPRPVDANKLIQGMSELLQRTIPEVVSMETVLAGGLWRVHVDVNQLENAILNLAVNARDAMRGGGKLTIETSNAYLDETYAVEHADVSPGQYVQIALTDTGTGMPDAVLARAFDPFFTTKPDGQGTGLGLSQVHGFLKQSGGHVKIYSEVGHGTTVKLYLPRFVGPEAAALEAPLTSTLRTSSSNEMVLVVEDDDRVRATTVELLGELGYRVVEATSAVAALRALDTHPDISLLFTDVVMPEMNGRKLADEVIKRHPEVKILFTTGYTRNAIVHNGVLDPGVHLIIKPFTLEALAAKISDVLSE